MTLVNHVPRSLAEKHAAFEAELARRARTLIVEHARRIDPTSPAGRRHLRGIPCIGMGGLDTRRDPLLWLLDEERWPSLPAEKYA